MTVTMSLFGRDELSTNRGIDVRLLIALSGGLFIRLGTALLLLFCSTKSEEEMFRVRLLEPRFSLFSAEAASNAVEIPTGWLNVWNICVDATLNNGNCWAAMTDEAAALYKL